LGVYAWVSFVLVVVTALRRRGSWLTAMTLAPLLLSYGLTTFLWHDPSLIAGILRFPIPAGLPAAGLRAALANIYWAPVEPVGSRLGSIPDVWSPAFPLGYAVAIVVLAHAARFHHATWLRSLTLAGLVGFLGLLVSTLAPVVGVVWAGLEVLRFVRSRREGPAMLALAIRSGAALALAGLLLLFGGGTLTRILTGTGSSGLAWTSGLDARHWQVLGTFDVHPGGIGLLSLGSVAVAGAAAAMALRDRLVLALAASAGLLALAWLALDYPLRPEDLGRLAGHARNLALVALLLALSARLARLPSSRRRVVAVALLAGLVVWPTVVAPARSLGSALGDGVQLANARWAWGGARGQNETAALRRYSMPGMSGLLAAYVRAHTAVDARVLDPTRSQAVLLHTGRPNNLGFADVVQQQDDPGPEYLDASHYLEPAAFRRLGLAYVYSTDEWVAGLPARSRNWLADPELFDLLARDGAESLYRVRPEFLAIQSAPHPDSFEALRNAVPPGTVVYLPPFTQSDYRIQVGQLRVASVLPDARLVGAVHPRVLHLRTPAPWPVEPLGASVPELVTLPLLHEGWRFPPAGWRQIWRNPPSRVAVYAPTAAGEPSANATPTSVRLRLADVEGRAEHLMFTATLNDHGSLQWTGQDWVLVPVDASPWGIPDFRHDWQPVITQWFAGQAAGGGATTHTYVFDARTSSLAVRGENGDFTTVQASKRTPSPGAWMLALRLNRLGDRGVQEPLFAIPVLRFEVSDAGTVSSLQIYEDTRGWRSP